MIVAKIVASCLLIICLLIAIYSLYLLYRTDNVCKFRRYVIELCFKAQVRSVNNGIFNLEQYDSIYYKHSYNDMLYSFKPLKLEYWFTKEEIELLNKYK